MMEKRFLVFSGDTYYPAGGWEDFDSSYDSLENAKNAAQDFSRRNPHGGWWHIVDLEKGEICAQS